MIELKGLIKAITDQAQQVPPVVISKVGVLIVNTGTPAACTYWSVRQYLSQFLNDRRVVEISRLLWWPILYLFVLVIRPFKKKRCYRSIWNWEENESPLRTITRSQAKQLAQRFEDSGVDVDWAFRYGGPSISDKIKALREKGCDRLLVVPLFPQYAAPTSATVIDEAFRALQNQRNQMCLRTVTSYYSNANYISAIAKSVNTKIAEIESVPEVILYSYHGIPLSCHINGDPYCSQCHETSRLINMHLDVQCEYITCFQSKFGMSEWLKPYTEEVVATMARTGVKRMLVVAPGFVSDCLETIEEIRMDAAQKFYGNGGEDFIYVPCLNDSADGISVIESVIRQHIQGFL